MLAAACQDTGMHFSAVPTEKFHVKSAIPNNIGRTSWDVGECILELLSTIKLRKGEPIGLQLVILPDNKCFHAKIKEACNNLGVHQCCMPCDVYKPSKRYLKGTAHAIKAKVIKEGHVHTISVRRPNYYSWS